MTMLEKGKKEEEEEKGSADREWETGGIAGVKACAGDLRSPGDVKEEGRIATGAGQNRQVCSVGERPSCVKEKKARQKAKRTRQAIGMLRTGLIIVPT